MLKKTMFAYCLFALLQALFIIPGGVNTACAAVEATKKIEVVPNAIPEGVTEAEWTSPDTSTARGLSIALAKMTKAPAVAHEMFSSSFLNLKPEHLSLMQEAYITVIKSNVNLGKQAVALCHMAEAFGEYYKMRACIDEFNRAGYLTKETNDKNDFDLAKFGGGMVYIEKLNPQAQAMLAPYMSEEAYHRIFREYMNALNASIEIDKEHNKTLRETNAVLRAALKK